MSTIPLSMREGHGQTISGEDAQPPSTSSDTSLDDSISGAWDKFAGTAEDIADTISDRTKIREREEEPLKSVEGEGWASLVTDPDRAAPAPREEALEKIMRGREEKLAEREITTKQYSKAQPWFDECGKLGVSPDALLRGFKAWDDRYDQGPEAAAYALAEAGFRMGPHAVEAAPDDADPDEQYNDPLDKQIAKAMREKDSGKNYAKVIEAWKEIQAKYPNERLDDVMRRSVLILKDMGRDPWHTAARIAASKGMPVTPPAQEAAAREQQAQAQTAAVIEHGMTYLPNMKDPAYRREMGEVMSRSDFVSTGDDQADMARAHRLVELYRQQPDNVRATIDHYGPGHADYAEVRPYVEAVLRSKSLKLTYDTRVDADLVWKTARTAMQTHTQQQRARRSTLDGSIEYAFARAGM